MQILKGNIRKNKLEMNENTKFSENTKILDKQKEIIS